MNVTRLLLKKHHRLAASVAVAFVLLLSAVPIAQALTFPTFGSPIRITTNTGFSQLPHVAAAGSHVYVAWQDDTPVSGSGSGPEIWMRVSSNNGASFGPAIRISTNTGYSLYPSVAGSGSYVYVAWADDTHVAGSGPSAHPEIWMRVSSNNGASFGSAIRISTNTYASAYPSVAAWSTYVYVAWQDDTPVPGSGSFGYPEIWMRVSNNNGGSFGSPIRITTNTSESAYPSVVTTGGSYVWVAWHDGTPGSDGSYEIWLRVSSDYGASFAPAIRISNNAYVSLLPRVAASGHYVYVAWLDDTPVPGSGVSLPPYGPAEIWMRVSNNYGASFGSAIRISYNAYMSLDPSVAASGSYVYVAWADYTPVSGSGNAPEIWLRASSNYGTTFGSAVRMSTNTGYSGVPSVAAAGSYVYVAWEDFTPVRGSGACNAAPYCPAEIWLRVGS